MTIKELTTLAIEAISETPKPIDPKIVLIMPGERGKLNKKRLLPSGKRPIGEIIEETNNGLSVVFNAIDILAFCISVEIEPIE